MSVFFGHYICLVYDITQKDLLNHQLVSKCAFSVQAGNIGNDCTGVINPWQKNWLLLPLPTIFQRIGSIRLNVGFIAEIILEIILSQTGRKKNRLLYYYTKSYICLLPCLVFPLNKIQFKQKCYCKKSSKCDQKKNWLEVVPKVYLWEWWTTRKDLANGLWEKWLILTKDTHKFRTLLWPMGIPICKPTQLLKQPMGTWISPGKKTM